MGYLMAATAALEAQKEAPQQDASLMLAQRMLANCKALAKQCADITHSVQTPPSFSGDKTRHYMLLLVGGRLHASRPLLCARNCSTLDARWRWHAGV